MTTSAHKLAQQLANSARQIKDAISTALAAEDQAGLHGPWHQQLEGLQQTLLPTLTAAEFADMYAQTIVYGLFATRIIPQFPLCASVFPVMKPCMQQDGYIAALIDDCTRMLEHMDMSDMLRDFGKATMQHDPVVHFYEDFLAAYDPKTREMRGVYYTPEPVVSYIVRSVDCLLQTHFCKPMGLADGDTIILDPATGMATFLHAVVQHIYATLQHMGMADTWDTYVAEKLLPRLFGFELLMAPYTMAHLKLSMLLQQLGYTLGSNERLGISLTNAFANNTAIEPPRHQAHQKHAEDNIIVILGNPPYSNYGMLNKGKWIQEQLKDYKRGLQERKLNLDDDFIKFIRFGQWRIEQPGQGILAFITSNTYIDGITHRRMRQSLLETFTDIYILDLHGNSLKKEVCPDGSYDKNVFAIRQGVAIGIFVKQPGKTPPANVHHAEIWGTREQKYAWLLAHDVATVDWQNLTPREEYFFFVPKHLHQQAVYEQHASVKTVFPVGGPGVKTERDRVSIHFKRTELEAVVENFRKADVSTLRATYGLGGDSRDWSVAGAKADVLAHTGSALFQEILYRPFDRRHIWYSGQTRGFIGTPSYPTMRHMIAARNDNLCMIVTRQTKFEFAVFCTTLLADKSCANSVDINTILPLYLYLYPDEIDADEHFGLSHSYAPKRHTAYRNDYCNARCPNLSASFVRDVEQRLGLTFIPDGKGDLCTTVGTEDIFHYIYAIFSSPTYRTRYAEFLRIDFPRVPITKEKGVFATLAAYGAALVDLHLLRLPGSGGVGGAGGAAILNTPGEQGVAQYCVTSIPIKQLRYDEQLEQVSIAEEAFFSGIAPETWDMRIGGYQPLYKWLKGRKGRTLSFDDATYYMRMVIGLRETRRLMAEIDVVFRDAGIGNRG